MPAIPLGTWESMTSLSSCGLLPALAVCGLIFDIGQKLCCLSLLFSVLSLLPTQSSATRAVPASPSTAVQQQQGRLPPPPGPPGPPGPTGRQQPPIDPGIGTGTNLIDHGSKNLLKCYYVLDIEWPDDILVANG